MPPQRAGSPLTSYLLLFAFLLVVGVTFTYSMMRASAGSDSSARIALPTAQIRRPTPQPDGPVVPIAARIPTAAPQPTDTPQPAPTAQPIQVAAVQSFQPETPTQNEAPTLSVIVGDAVMLIPSIVATPSPIAPRVDGLPAGSIPILMYHYVRDVDQTDAVGYNLSVAPELFAQQMAWLHDNGYTTIQVAQLARCLRSEASCPDKAVVLTFDDGYSDAHSAALPILQQYGFTATFYIVSDFVGSPGYIGWEEIADLRDAGMEIGAHSVTHPDLTALDLATAEWQITQSKRDLEQRLGVTVVSFCYPTGLYNATLETLVSAAGYTSATTTRWDFNTSDLFALPRRRVAGGTGVEAFAAIVWGY